MIGSLFDMFPFTAKPLKGAFLTDIKSTLAMSRRLSLFPTKKHSKFIDIEVKVEELATTGAERRSLATYDSIKKYLIIRKLESHRLQA